MQTKIKKTFNLIILTLTITTFQINTMDKNLSVEELDIAIKTNNFEKFKRIIESYSDMENLFERHI